MLLPALAQAQTGNFALDCAHYIARRGYATDYVEQRIGKGRQGQAIHWRANTPVLEVKAGDAVFVATRQPAPPHMAAVEEVRKDADGKPAAVRVSEWNYGRLTDERCNVTDSFGRLAPERWIDINLITGVWRPR